MKPTLSEEEDRMLAMADGEWVDAQTAQAILESWFARPFTAQVVKDMLRQLHGQGLLSCHVRARVAGAERMREEAELSAIEFKTSGRGVSYLQSTPGFDSRRRC